MTVPAPAPQIARQECWPVIPDRLEDLGIPRAIVTDLILRYLWLHGSGTLGALHESLKLSFPLLETTFHQFRQQQLLEVKGMTGNDYSFTLTASGRNLASARNEVCQYVGPAPVSIQEYSRVVKAQAAKVRLSRESLRRAFEDLVMPDGLLDALGPSLIGHQSLFLYGGTGNGKTSIAERILRIYHDCVVVPYAVEVDGHIITLFDPVVHRQIPYHDDQLDPRWVVCERPCITVGGELSREMLELQLDESTRVFISPCQMKANNGILIIDDFGRQMLSPRDLLNRWIVPLDRRVDYLTLASRHEIPGALRADGGLLDQPRPPRPRRRSLPAPHPDQGAGGEREPGDLRQDLPARGRRPTRPRPNRAAPSTCANAAMQPASKFLRACYPMDIYKLVKAISEYEGRPVRMTKANIDRAVGLYFAKTKAGVEE